MCKNHNLRHISPEIVAYCEKVVRQRDRGGEENVEHLLEQTLISLMWSGLTNYVYEVIQYHDPEMFAEGDELCWRAFRRNKLHMQRWIHEHPEANTSTITVTSDVVRIELRGDPDEQQ